MKLVAAESWGESVPLTRPYAIARKTTSAVELFFVRLVAEDGTVGLGSASPAPDVTGETAEACRAALDPEALAFLKGADARRLGSNCRRAGRELAATPAARAAVDVALHDLCARVLGVPLVELLGERRSEPLATSITIGIRSVEETLAEAREYVGRGFRCLKVKLGRSLDEDVERLVRLRETFGADLGLRADANEGYAAPELLRLADATAALGLEFVEQPLARSLVGELRGMPEALRSTIALDESLKDETDALELLRPPAPCSVFVVKLMKCGGVSAALRIAAIAEAAGLGLMWGCMDESVVSIAAALHAAYASPATRYLDLDGSFDLARDPAEGGFRVDAGRLVLGGGPGLGVRLRQTT